MNGRLSAPSRAVSVRHGAGRLWSLAAVTCVLLVAGAEEARREPGGQWKVLFRVPVGRISPWVNQVQIRKGADGQLYFVGPAFVACRDGKTGQRVWRTHVEGEKGWLGVRIEPAVGGVKATEVLDLPAANAGLKAEDVLTKIDGTPVPTPSVLVAVVSGLKTGDRKEVEYLRGGETLKVEVIIGARPRPRRWLGEDRQRVYVAFDNQVLGLDRESGKAAWAVELDSPPGFGSAEVTLPIPWNLGVGPVGLSPGGKLLLHVEGRRLMGLETVHGQPFWSLDASSSPVDSPLLLGDRVLFLAEGGQEVCALRAEDGADLPALSFTEAGLPEPFRRLTAMDGRLFAAKSGEVYCIDPPAGKVAWKADLKGRKWVDLLPAAGRVYVRCQQSLRAYSTADGSLLWEKSLPSDLQVVSLAAAGDKFFLAFSDGSVRGLNARDGSSLWVSPAGGEVVGVSLVGDSWGLVALVSASEEGAFGTRAQELDTATGVRKTLAEARGRAFLVQRQGDEIVLLTGEELVLLRREGG